jgi:hypothetical protein
MPRGLTRRPCSARRRRRSLRLGVRCGMGPIRARWVPSTLPARNPARGASAARGERPLEAERGFRSLPEPLQRGVRVASHPAGVFSEFTVSGQLGKTPSSWRGVDRLMLRGGLDAERIHYFDTAPILLAGGAGELRLFFDTFPIASGCGDPAVTCSTGARDDSCRSPASRLSRAPAGHAARLSCQPRHRRRTQVHDRGQAPAAHRR